MLLSRSLKPAVLALGLVAPLLLGGCDRQSAAPAQPEANGAPAKPAKSADALQGVLDRSHKGSLMPDFVLTDPAGKRLVLADLAGRPVLVNLWATWCAPCVAEMPTLDALAAAQAGKLRVLTVSQDMNGAEKVAAFFARHRLARLEPWLDPNNDLGFHFGGEQLPLTILYDANRREVWRMTGGHDWSTAETAALLAEAD